MNPEKTLRLLYTLTILLYISSCTMGFEEETLMDTPNRTVPNINGDFPLFPKQHMNSKCSNTRKIPNFKSSFLS